MLHVDIHGGGPRVALVHGFTQTGRSWVPVLDRLARRRSVACVDAPGHGRSAHHHGADLWEAARLVGDACGEADYVGYSMGGRLCLHLALRRPELVRRLVLLGATPGIEDSRARDERRRSDEELARSLERDGLERFLEGWLANPLFAGLPSTTAGLDSRRENTVEGLAASLRTMGTGNQASLWPDLSSLSIPVLVLAGERDERFAAIGSRVAHAIGPNASFATVPGAGHAAHLEAPDPFCDLVERFLGRDHDHVTPNASSAP